MPPPHVTFVAFGGKDRGIARELALSAFSLSRSSPRAEIDVVTDSDDLARQFEDTGLPVRARVRRIDREDVLRRFSTFGLQRFAHHSGLGGYSKLLLADLLPVNATILVDTDTVFVNSVAPLWALRHRLARTGGVLAAKRLKTGGACLRGQRINSGVVLYELERMRSVRWVSTMLTKVAALGHRGVSARDCGKMVRNNGTTLAAGDQEVRVCSHMHMHMHMRAHARSLLVPTSRIARA